MTIRPVTYYQVVCDHPHCEHSTEDDGGDFSAYSDPAGAGEEWEGGNQTLRLADGQPAGHYCNEHRVPVCSFCDEGRTDLTTGSDGTTLACAGCLAEGEVTA